MTPLAPGITKLRARLRSGKRSAKRSRPVCYQDQDVWILREDRIFHVIGDLRFKRRRDGFPSVT